MSTIGIHSDGLTERAPFPSHRLVPPPVRARRIAKLLVMAFIGFVAFALLVPWQQSAGGAGRVIAYAPLERRQNLEAPVTGRVVEWFVQEGAVVRRGDAIVRIADNDPQLMARLDAERVALTAKLESYEAKVAALNAKLEAVTRAEDSNLLAKEADVRAAEQKVTAAAQDVTAYEAALTTARLQLKRQKTLRDEGLVSERKLELAQLKMAKERTRRDAAKAKVREANDALRSKEAQLDKARADRDSKIQTTRASLASAESDVATTQGSLSRLGVTISRQQAQLVVAPRDGVILRLVANQGGEQVKSGDTLAVLVPDTDDRAVEVWVDGNDAALITPGRSVRLQFEGWPAVQFTGWPSVAVGTFGGLVSFVDATDDGKGNFRVVVVPDPSDEPWPEVRFLRQGTRANGWVLLGEVSVGFELWRQFNGFPPVLDAPPSTDPYSSSPKGGGVKSGGGASKGGVDKAYGRDGERY